MSSERSDRYLDRVRQVLAARGIRNARFVDEAREHLLDAIDAGLRRGLTRDAAEEDALARFGPPDLVAAGCEDEERHMAQHAVIGRLTNGLGSAWRRKWWVLVPTAAMALVTVTGSYFLLPTRYRSASGIVITEVPASFAEVPASFADQRPAADNRMKAGVERMIAQVLSPPHLERIITDFDLYPRERQLMSIDSVAGRMLGDIAIDLFTPSELPQAEAAGFRVSFVSSTPRVAMKVTERLASLFIEENLMGRERQNQTFRMGLDARIEGMKREIIQYETELESRRSHSGGKPLSQADLIPYDVMKDVYKTLLVERVEWKFLRRGQQFKVVEPARLPERPFGPTRAQVNLAGTLAGLALGVVLMSVRRGSTGPSSS